MLVGEISIVEENRLRKIIGRILYVKRTIRITPTDSSLSAELLENNKGQVPLGLRTTTKEKNLLLNK